MAARVYDEDDLAITERMPWNSGDDRKFRRKFLRTDEESNTVDALGRVLSIVSPHEVSDEGAAVHQRVARTSYSYYDSDWIRSVSDQKLVDIDGSFGGTDAKVTTFEYDSLDRESQTTVDPDDRRQPRDDHQLLAVGSAPVTAQAERHERPVVLQHPGRDHTPRTSA